MFKKYNDPTDKKQHSNLGQLNSLLIMCILPLWRGWFLYFGSVGSHNQSCTSHMLINLLVTSLFCIHAWYQVIEVTRKDKSGVLQFAMISTMVRCLPHSLNDIMSALRRSPNQPIRGITACFEHYFTGRKLRYFEVLAKCVWPSNRCLQHPHKASWSFVEMPRSCIKRWLNHDLYFTFPFWLLF